MLIHGVWILIASLTFCLGYLASYRNPVEAAPLSGIDREGRSSSQPGNRAAAGLASATDGGGPITLTGEQARERVFYCLSKTDRIERIRLLCELLASVTKDNWKEVEDAFSRQQSKEFRITNWERELMIDRLGQIAGGDDVEAALIAANGQSPVRAGALLRGWAGAEPRKALAWFEGQKPEVQRSILGDFLTGLSLQEPKRAMDIILRYGEEEKDYCIWRIVSNAIQRDGFHGAEAMFGSLMADSSVDESARGKVFISLLTRRFDVAKSLGQPADNLDWYDGYLRPGSPAGPHATELIIADAAKSDAVGTAKWLDERDARLSPTQQQSAYSAMARSYLNAAPDQCVVWIEQHAEHPQYDAMVQATAAGLAAKGKFDEVRRLVSGVKDGAVRAKLQASLAR